MMYLVLGWVFPGEGTFLGHNMSKDQKHLSPDVSVSGVAGIHIQMLM